MSKISILISMIVLLTLPVPLRAGPETSCPYSVVFYSGRGENQDVYVLHPGEKEPLNLTNHPAKDNCPAPSPDGKRIAFLSGRGGSMGIYTMNIDGSDVRRLTNNEARDERPLVSPDGSRIVFMSNRDGNFEIYRARRDGSDRVRLTDHPAWDGWASFVP